MAGCRLCNSYKDETIRERILGRKVEVVWNDSCRAYRGVINDTRFQGDHFSMLIGETWVDIHKVKHIERVRNDD